jgi:molybdate transport system substrate-binding protein
MRRWAAGPRLTLMTLMMIVGGRAFAQELRIAAAADLTPVMPALSAAYAQASGVKLVASFGSSATLTQQIENGLPVDVFLSADLAHPQQLATAGRTVEAAPVPYAHGVLVLWARKDSPAQPINMDSLRNGFVGNATVKHVAIANPLHAPYGVAAMQLLDALKLTATLKSKLVVGENIAQTAQFAESGAAQVGLISKTIASSPQFQKDGTFIELPKLYKPIVQSGVVLKGAKNEAAGIAFLAWLTSDKVQATLPAMGLERER